MSGAESQTVLHKKLAQRSPGTGGGDRAQSGLHRALRLTVGRAAHGFHALEAALTGLDCQSTGLESLAREAEPPPLYLMLAGPGGRRGLAVADAAVIGAVLQHLTTGRIAPGEASARPPTRTDAVLVGDFADALLTQLDTELQALGTHGHLAGYRVASMLQDHREVGLALEDTEYERISLAIEFCRGARTGEMVLAVVRPGGAAAGDARWRRAWKRNLGEAEVALNAVLHRTTLSLADLAALHPGAVVDLPASCMARVSLEGADQRMVARARLGRSGPMRAVKLMAGAPQMPQTAQAARQATGQAAVQPPDQTHDPAVADPGAAPPQST